jgi:hypothetical protein
MLNKGLPDNYTALCVNKWKPLLEHANFPSISDKNILTSTAVMCENTMAEFEKKLGRTKLKAILESSSAGSTGVFGTYTGEYGKDGDARMPQVIMPVLRRAFPNLIAHHVVGVQPMTGPVGFAFALRAVYDSHGKSQTNVQGLEAGYNYVDAGFTGASASAPSFSGDAADAWQAFAGTAPDPADIIAHNDNSAPVASPYVFNPQSTGANTADAEWWKFGQSMPTVSFKMIKQTITAETRKLGANWSMELEEDMASMQGLDIREEFIDITGNELQQEIDRQIISSIFVSALQAGNVSSWTPVTADGRNQQERIATLYTEMMLKANEVAVKSRRGAANFAFASPSVCSLFSSTAFNPLNTTGFQADQNGLLTTNGVAKVGTFVQGGITLFRDTFANGDYIVLGYKGPTAYDSGVIYCPYVPLQMREIPGSDDLNPRMMIRTRYGITKNLLAGGNYYAVLNIKNLTSPVMGDDGTVTGRQFIMG